MTNHDHEGSRPSQRDAALERAWRAASTEQPPSQLDEVIRAAARKSVPDHDEQPNPVPVRIRSRSWLTRWQPLAAAAAVAGLAFVLVQLLPHPRDLAPPVQRNESAPVPASVPTPVPAPDLVEPPPSGSSASEATGGSQAPDVAGSPGLRDRDSVPDGAPAQSAVSAAPTAPVRGQISPERLKAVEPETAGRAATPAAAAPSSAARESSLDNAASLDPASWAAKVAALHESGDAAAAEDALREFRAAYPDADRYLPDSLRSWARTVR